VRILLVGPSRLAPPLVALGHDVVEAAALLPADRVPGAPFDVRPLWRSLDPVPELLLVVQDLEAPVLAFGIEDVPAPRLYWAIDVHLNWFWQRWYARLFDAVLVAQKDWVPLFAADGVPAHWLPWGAEDVFLAAPALPRVHDLAFVGTVDAGTRPKRAAAVEMLRRRFGLRVFGATAGERLDPAATAAVYAQARIVFNESVLGDVNFRVFEAMGAGAMLVTEAVENGLTDLFTPGIHLDTYGPATLVEKVGRWLGDEARREAVARAGRCEVAARHAVRARLAAATALAEPGITRREVGTDAARSFGLACHLALVRGLVHPEHGARVAAEHLRTALALRPDADVAIALGEMLVWIGRDAGALETLALARRIDPTAARAWLVAADIARRRGDEAEAARLVREAADRVPGLSPATRARVRAAAADLAGAEGCHALGLLLEEAGLPVAAGLVSQVRADVARTALDWHQRALAGDPGHGPAAERAAALLELAGMLEFAVPFRAAAARARPGDEHAAGALRRALAASYRTAG
jgi:hypothetical protein